MLGAYLDVWNYKQLSSDCTGLEGGLDALDLCVCALFVSVCQKDVSVSFLSICHKGISHYYKLCKGTDCRGERLIPIALLQRGNSEINLAVHQAVACPGTKSIMGEPLVNK